MIIFSPHALLKLTERKIEKDLVLRALEKPDKSMLGYGNRLIAFRRFKKLYLKVVFRKEAQDIVVITQHWVSKISNKYEDNL